MNDTNAKICPLMSNAEKKVPCTRSCAFSKPNPTIHECAIVQIVEAVDNLADKINELKSYINTNE